MAIITRKIKVIPIDINEWDEDFNNYKLKKDVYKEFRDFRYLAWKLKNKVISDYYLVHKEAEIRREDEPKRKLSEILKEVVHDWSGDECNTYSNYGYYLSKQYSDSLPSNIRNYACQNAISFFKRSYGGVLLSSTRKIIILIIISIQV